MDVDQKAPIEERDGVTSFLQSWAWKREHRPDRDRFHRPYLHSLTLPKGHPGAGNVLKLTFDQARLHGAQGFASTVWDSSIVVAKLLERHPQLVRGGAVLDLSAGCGLVAVVAAALGAARCVATDLPPNLPLLARNCKRNGVCVDVLEHWWGSDVRPLLLPRSGCDSGTGLSSGTAEGGGGAADAGGITHLSAGGEPGEGGSTGGGFDLVVACDVMYLEEAVGPLVTSLAALCGGQYHPGGNPPVLSEVEAEAAGPTTTTGRPNAAITGVGGNGGAGGDTGGGGGGEAAVASAASEWSPTTVLLAHGRNRFAEAAFWRHAAAAGFQAEVVSEGELDPVFRCSDVDVYRLKLRVRGRGGGMLEVDNPEESLAPFRRVFKGSFITAGGYLSDTGAAAVASGHTDLVAYGRWYLSTPDLHKRFLLGAPLNKYDRNTFYSSGLEGYTDYPTLEQLQAQKQQADVVA